MAAIQHAEGGFSFGGVLLTQHTPQPFVGAALSRGYPGTSSEDLQNSPIICANYSITLCEGASIIGVVKTYLPVFKQERAIVLPVMRKSIFSQALTLDREHASQLLQIWWRNSAHGHHKKWLTAFRQRISQEFYR
jgi:hypothetical protein